MITVVLALLAALGLSACFSGAELAFFTLGDSRVRALAEEGRRGSGSLSRLRERPERLLILLRVGDVVADVAAAVLAAVLGYHLGGIPGLLLGTLVVSVLVVLIGELGLLSVFRSRNVSVALTLAPVFLVLTVLLGPLLRLLDRAGRVVLASSAAAVGGLAVGEMRDLGVLADGEDGIQEHERELIERAFRLDETTAWDVMTPRVNIIAWPDSLRLADIAPELATVPYSRIPVYGENIDDVTGTLYLRDAYQALTAGQRDVRLGELAREPLIVPGSVPVSKLLRDFQARRIHLALVADEYGGIDGLVTLEDVLEELVGEIEDELDVAADSIIRVARNEIIAAGDADLREINHLFNLSLPQLEHRSLNGFLLEELGHVPEPGESVEVDGVRIEVLEATETQVVRARLRRLSPAREGAGAPSVAEDAEREGAYGPAQEVDANPDGILPSRAGA